MIITIACTNSSWSNGSQPSPTYGLPTAVFNEKRTRGGHLTNITNTQEEKERQFTAPLDAIFKPVKSWPTALDQRTLYVRQCGCS